MLDLVVDAISGGLCGGSSPGKVVTITGSIERENRRQKVQRSWRRRQE